MDVRSFDLSEIRPTERFSYWRDVLCKVYVTLAPERVPQLAFHGTVTDHPFHEIGISTITSVRQTIARTRSDIGRDTDAYCFLNLQVDGRCSTSQSRRSVVTLPGSFTIVDSSEPFLLDYGCDAWTQHSFKIPKHIFDAHVGQDLVARAAGNATPVGRIVVDFLSTVASNPQSFHHSALDMTKTILDLVAMSLRASAPDPGKEPIRSFRSPLRHAVLRHLELNFADPNITPAKVAAHFGISPRYLHKLLQERGETFGQIILNRRLERCALELGKGTCLTISEVAFRYGFNDMSHFSRAFRRRFGVTPRDYRP
jgi:AraC family transcriptional regulator, positive regulator of tynA and feaB